MQDLQANHLIVFGLGLVLWCVYAWETWTRSKTRIGLYGCGVVIPLLIVVSLVLFIIQPATLESSREMIFTDIQRFFLFNAIGGAAVAVLMVVLQLPLWLATRNRPKTFWR